MALSVRVLGSAAGGGVPQWNCRCHVCRLAWAGDKRVLPRTQASLAVSGDGRQWAFVGASPDIGSQIRANPFLQPGDGEDPRSSPIVAVVLVNGELDTTSGLLSLRETQSLVVVASASVRANLLANPMYKVLRVPGVEWILARSHSPLRVAGVTVELIAVPGKVPLYLEDETVDPASEGDETMAVAISDGTSAVLYSPNCAALTPGLIEVMNRTDVLLFDGTFFTDREMIDQGVGTKTARRMGHIPISGPDGSLEMLHSLAARRIFTHINNTNPVLIEGSRERSIVEAAGWELAFDGMGIML